MRAPFNSFGRLALTAVLAAVAICASPCLNAGVAPAKGDRSVTITIVYDNVDSEDPKLRSDWGFGCIVDVGGKRILFDTGEEGDALLSNMGHLGIDPSSIDAVAISHIHSDHAGGLKLFLTKRRGIRVYLPSSFPAPFKRMVEEAGSKPVDVTGPHEIAPGVLTIGEMGSGVREQALAVETAMGPLVITGCAHPGIVEVLRRAAKVTGARPYAALGGFHTSMASKARIERIIASFQDLGVKKVIPCHCSGRTARRLFEKAYGADFIEAKVGSRIALP